MSLIVVSPAMALPLASIGFVNIQNAVDVSLDAEVSTDGDNAGSDLNSFEFKEVFNDGNSFYNTGYSVGSVFENDNIMVNYRLSSQSSQISESGYILLLGVGLFSMSTVRRILKD